MTARVSMPARSTLLLTALVGAGFAVVLLLRSFNTPAPVASGARAPVMQVQATRDADEMAPAVAPQPAAPAKPAEALQAVDAENALGQAQGAIHFEKKPAERDGKGESID
ncbi:MAG TPA: hypothetical protein VMF89_10670, partial [Polyangiales bacterium]|nr:hypothetical protein [Polyangiales bacterium]